MWSRTFDREAISSGRSKPVPVFFGTKMALFIPRPQAQVPKRTGIFSPDAQAVPLSFRKQFSRGNPMVTAEPLTIPRNTRRRLNFFFTSYLRLVPRVTGSPGVLAVARYRSKPLIGSVASELRPWTQLGRPGTHGTGQGYAAARVPCSPTPRT